MYHQRETIPFSKDYWYMLDYMKPVQRYFNPNMYTLHVGTNDLLSDKSPEQISEEIFECNGIPKIK